MEAVENFLDLFDTLAEVVKVFPMILYELLGEAAQLAREFWLGTMIDRRPPVRCPYCGHEYPPPPEDGHGHAGVPH